MPSAAEASEGFLFVCWKDFAVRSGFLVQRFGQLGLFAGYVFLMQITFGGGVIKYRLSFPNHCGCAFRLIGSCCPGFLQVGADLAPFDLVGFGSFLRNADPLDRRFDVWHVFHLPPGHLSQSFGTRVFYHGRTAVARVSKTGRKTGRQQAGIAGSSFVRTFQACYYVLKKKFNKGRIF
jgi:hypothetical protein